MFDFSITRRFHGVAKEATVHCRASCLSRGLRFLELQSWIDTVHRAIERSSNMSATQRNLFVTLAVGAFAVLAAGSAFADDPTPDHSAQALSTKTRAQVASEMAQARRDGSGKVWSFSYQNKVQNLVPSIRSRQEMKSEVLAARSSGELVAAGEVGPTGPVATRHARRTTLAE
jgi:hypothetical protein